MSLPTKPLTRTRALLRAARKRLLGENGNVLLIVILAMPVIMACAAFAIDVANVWAARQHVQAAADAAALAGAQNMDGNAVDQGNAQSIAKTYLGKNNVDVDNSTVTSDTTAESVTVSAHQNVPMFFSGLFGLHDATVSASATAQNASKPVDPGEPSNATITKGSTPANGWDNFCASDGVVTGGSTLVNNQGGGCASTENIVYAEVKGVVVPALTVVHGGIDISPTSDSGTPGEFMSGNAGTVMFDLVGTCVEAGYGSGCENNADGEVQLEFTNLVPGFSYDATFYLDSNAGGGPLEKAMAAAASETPFDQLPAMADTTGNSTSYPLETGKSYATKLLAYQEYAYAAQNNGYQDALNHPWVKETLTFTPTENYAYVALGSLENCVGDETTPPPNSDVFTLNTFSSSLVPGAAAELASSYADFSQIPQQSYDNPNLKNGPQAKGGCRFGAAISDWDINPASNNTISLTK